MNAAVQSFQSWEALERAHGAPVLFAAFKQTPEDFHVDEILGFDPDGNGEHLMLQIEKNGLTTFEAQAILAKHYRVPLRDTAFAGMKDKQGVTRQWFSLPVKRDSAAESLQHPRMRVLSSVRNSRKLRRGTHKGNRFRVVLRDARGDSDAALERIRMLAAHGVPNYFGVQRFGRGETNVPEALAWFRGERSPTRAQRSLLLSSARSYLFNTHLSRRVHDATWNAVIAGDIMALAGTASTFASDRATVAELCQRLAAFDVHVTGPLWGRGQPPVTATALTSEMLLAEQFPELCAGLAAHGLEQERRPLRAVVSDLQAHFDADSLILEFTLARGTYATSVLRELVHTETA